MYDYVIVTHLPAFYKVNLYNEIAKNVNIFVIFIASDTDEKRASDFSVLDDITFEYKIINSVPFQKRNKLTSTIQVNKFLKSVKYRKVIVSGWDLIEFWAIVLMNSKDKNCLALESTIFDSNTDGIKGFIKKIFLSRISLVFASGKPHVKLLDALSYKKDVRVTLGVGIINKVDYSKKSLSYEKKFLYIGRLAKEKNLDRLIHIFNTLPDYTFTIIGEGPEKENLKTIAKENIKIVGAISNKELKEKYLSHNIFILSSTHEPWGLVVEEALYFGRPVILSKYAGACELIKNGSNGFIIEPHDEENIKRTILKINDKMYAELLKGVEEFSIEAKDKYQITQYNV